MYFNFCTCDLASPRLSTERSSTAHVEYFTKKFSEPQNDLEGLKCDRTPLGLAVVADASTIGNVHVHVHMYTCTLVYAYGTCACTCIHSHTFVCGSHR